MRVKQPRGRPNKARGPRYPYLRNSNPTAPIGQSISYKSTWTLWVRLWVMMIPGMRIQDMPVWDSTNCALLKLLAQKAPCTTIPIRVRFTRIRSVCFVLWGDGPAIRPLRGDGPAIRPLIGAPGFVKGKSKERTSEPAQGCCTTGSAMVLGKYFVFGCLDAQGSSHFIWLLL